MSKTTTRRSKNPILAQAAALQEQVLAKLPPDMAAKVAEMMKQMKK